VETDTANADDSLLRVCSPLPREQDGRITRLSLPAPLEMVRSPLSPESFWQRYNSVSGLFLGSGTSLANAGPGGAVLAYVLMGTVMASVISCLIEMTALMPVNAPAMEFPRRFLDRGVGFSIGWMYWYVVSPHSR
jgi:amino acid transporter